MLDDADRDKAKKGIRARQDAVKALIEKYQQEFDEMHVANRMGLGLPPQSSGPSREKREQQIKAAKERIAKWEQELRDWDGPQ